MVATCTALAVVMQGEQHSTFSRDTSGGLSEPGTQKLGFVTYRYFNNQNQVLDTVCISGNSKIYLRKKRLQK